MDEDYYFRIDHELSEDKAFVLIIYDVISNKSPNKFSKILLISRSTILYFIFPIIFKIIFLL